jgi:hypothetical protein
MRYTQLFERFVNVFDEDSKKKYADQVWDILQKSYEKVGGFHSAANIEELIAKTGMWKLVVRDGHVYAASLYKDHLGRKSIASGTDGSDLGKSDYNRIAREDVSMQRAWAEVSGFPEALLKRAKAKPIPNTFASALTGKEILELNPDGFHYTRLISGHPHEKMIYGVIDIDPDTMAKLEQQGINLHELPSNIRLVK